MTTKIEWTNEAWNPVTGCTKISPGCQNCYAERMAKRLKAMGMPEYQNGFKVTMHPHRLEKPLGWRKPCKVFVNSMGDLFHDNVDADFIQDVFSMMSVADLHTYQVLTKRTYRLARLDEFVLFWPDNVWMGVTVESADYLHRLDDLRATGAAVKFVSFEPLLGPIGEFDLSGIDWVIAGGETGPRARPMDLTWALSLLSQCKDAGIPFFFKGYGGKRKRGRELLGREWNEFPKEHA